MTAADRKLLFAALGFLGVMLRRGDRDERADERALTIAGLAEKFCREHVPETFEGDIETDNEATRDRMASVIRDLVKSNGLCSRHDLEEQGFSESEIRRYWLMAHALAGVSLILNREGS